MTDKQLICLLIDSAKCIAKLLKASNKAAFDYVIESTYSYCCLHGISCETLSFYNFRKAIYDYLAYGETIILSEDIKKCIKMNFTKSSKPTAIDTSFINNVLEAERISRLIEKERQERITENDRETAEIRFILKKNLIIGLYDTLMPLINWGLNHNQIDNSFMFDIFRYGYIEGKRAERLKRKRKYTKNRQ